MATRPIKDPSRDDKDAEQCQRLATRHQTTLQKKFAEVDELQKIEGVLSEGQLAELFSLEQSVLRYRDYLQQIFERQLVLLTEAHEDVAPTETTAEKLEEDTDRVLARLRAMAGRRPPQLAPQLVMGPPPA